MYKVCAFNGAMHRLIKHNIQIRFNLWTDWGSSVFFCINFGNLVIIQLQPETGWQDKTKDLKQVVQRNRDKSSETISWKNVRIKKRMHFCLRVFNQAMLYFFHKYYVWIQQHCKYRIFTKPNNLQLNHRERFLKYRFAKYIKKKEIGRASCRERV